MKKKLCKLTWKRVYKKHFKSHGFHTHKSNRKLEICSGNSKIAYIFVTCVNLTVRGNIK